jgi:hypothetical protein
MASTIGKWIGGNSLFITGQPKAFSPLLAKHFLLVESLMLPANAALATTHYVASMATKPERKALMHQQLLEASQRSEALIFWSQQLTSKREEVPNVAARIAMVSIQAFLMPFWLSMAAISPATVHDCLATATDLLAQKYVSTASGAPHHFYTPHIGHLSSAKQHHRQQGDTLTFEPAAMVFILFFTLIHFR